MSKRSLVAGLSVLSLIASGVVTAAPAVAASGPIYDGPLGHFNANYVNIRSSPSTSSAHVYGQGQKGQTYCFDGYVYSGSGYYWYYGTDAPTNVTGYVVANYINYIQGQRCVVA